jgi:hypothetical protein
MTKRKRKRGSGDILTAGREEAAREHLVRVTSELMNNLQFIMNGEDAPGLSAIDNQRRRYANILGAMGDYFVKIGGDKLPQLGTYIAALGVALEDLIRGVTDPLFVTKKGKKRDSMRIWGARLQVALGLECFISSGLSRKKAADKAKKYKALASLKRSENWDLEGSFLSWYDRFIEELVPVPELLENFQTTRRAIKAAKLPPEEYRRIGERYFEQAVKSAIR